jgi:outer membrane receptor protein involved in Fe transport
MYAWRGNAGRRGGQEKMKKSGDEGMNGGFSSRIKALASATMSVVALVFTVLTSLGGAAWAQVAVTASHNPGVLEEIVVTAQKRTENVQDVPISMSVLTGDTLEKLHATSLMDYAAYLPGVVVTPNGSPGQETITLRGLAQLSPASSVGLYLDDTPVGTSSTGANESSLAFDMMPYDVERIEVLKGPQGTLYGANSMGGLVKYVTISPDLKNLEGHFGTEVLGVQGGDGAGFGVRGAVNVPLIADTLALRASYYDQHTPGYIKNPTTGDNGENALRQQGGRLALLWQANENLSVKVQAIVQKIDSDNPSSVLRSLIYVPAPFYPPSSRGKPVATGVIADLTHPHPLNEPFDKEVDYFSGTVNWSLGFADLTSATSYQSTRSHIVTDESPSLGPLIDSILSTPAQPVTGSLSSFINDLRVKRWTEELRLASHSDSRLEWLIGAYFDDERIENDQDLTALTASQQPIPDLTLGLASIPNSYREYSVFANSTYKITEAFDISAGLRWSKNQQAFRQISTGLAFGESDVPGTSGEHVLTYDVSPRYHVNSSTMVYLRLASGYRPGEPNGIIPGVPNIPPQVNADTTVNYEAGLKTEFLDHRAWVDVAVYRIDWKDIQLPDTGPTGVGFTVNGGTARTKGVELSTSFSPIRNWQLTASGAYTDGKLTQDVLGDEHWLKGAALPQAPHWTASFATAYQFAVSADWKTRVQAGDRFVGDRWMNVEGQGATRRANSSVLDSYNVVDLSAGLFNNHWDFSVYAKNATNKRAYVRDSFTFAPAYIVSTVLRPRTIGASVEFNF